MHQKWHIQTWACVPLDINPNLRPKCAPQSQSWGMWGKHEEPYVYTCPFQMPTEEMDPKKLCYKIFHHCNFDLSNKKVLTGNKKNINVPTLAQCDFFLR